jgi:recombination protein RecA
LHKIGIDTAKKFVFVQSGCTEEVFSVAESTILKARQMTKDVPVTIIWDSVAASAPKAELEGEYDQNTIGLQARVIGKGMRKITNIIGNQNVLFLLINQQRMKIGVMFGDPCVSPETKIKVRRKQNRFH